MSRRETAAEVKARVMGKSGPSKGNSIAENYAKNVAGSAGPLFDQPKAVLNGFAGCIAKLSPLLAMPNMTGVPRNNLKEVIEFLQAYRVPESVASDEALRVKEMQEEIERLQKRQSAPSVVEVPAVSPSGPLPPPSTYAEAVRREFNRAKHAEARADKLNRAKMAAVSSEAAKIRQQEKELALRQRLWRATFRSMFARTNKELLRRRNQRKSQLLLCKKLLW